MKHVATLFLLAVIGWSGYTAYATLIPCARTIKYSIGTIDSGFSITEEELKVALSKAESIWEEEQKTNLFEYDPKASFKVNLVYDERQERTDESIRASKELEQFRSRLDRLRTEHVSFIEQYEEVRSIYEKNRTEDNRRKVNERSQEANAKGEHLNRMVSEYNMLVNDFNDKFGHGIEFNQGVYTGKDISIFQFTNMDDLVTVLGHEFGHALRIDHVTDPQALMYYKIDKMSHTVTILTDADKKALANACAFTLK